MTRPSRWRAGTLAVAGKIPVNDVGTKVIPGPSQGHHPAGDRPATPTRGYESGSDGHSRHPASARHPCHPRPPPGARQREPHALAAPVSRRAALRRQGRLRRRCASAARPCDPGRRPRDLAAIKGHGASPARPRTTRSNHTEPSDNRMNQAQEQQELDGPLQMRSFTQAAASSSRYSRNRGLMRRIWKMIMVTCEADALDADLPNSLRCWNVSPPAYGGVPWG